ncbi:MAG: hypothetical protein ACLFQM_13095 [Fidelibacterota bacterium]
MDERFKLHQYKSTRLAIFANIAVLAFVFYYELIANKITRWDIFIVLSITAAVKIMAMIFYRVTN